MSESRKCAALALIPAFFASLFAAYEEHECREFFTWRDRRVFGPHISIYALYAAAEDLEFRE